MTEPVGYGWFALVGVAGLVVAALATERWWRERQRNHELVRALRVYLRDASGVRDGRDQRCVERRRAFIAELIELPPGELAPEWVPTEPEPVVEVAAEESEPAPLKVLAGGRQ